MMHKRSLNKFAKMAIVLEKLSQNYSQCNLWRADKYLSILYLRIRYQLYFIKIWTTLSFSLVFIKKVVLHIGIY